MNTERFLLVGKEFSITSGRITEFARLITLRSHRDYCFPAPQWSNQSASIASCNNYSKYTRKSSQLSSRHFKVVVVGDGGVGKTSMLMRFVQGHFLTEYSPTYYDSYTVSMALGNEWTQVSMTLIDTAGQETYDRIRALTYFDTDVFIVCFSVACPDSFINVRSRWITELKEFKPQIPIILIGTQKDLRDNPRNGTSFSSIPLSRHSPQFISNKEGKRLARKVNARMYAECSALTGEGLDDVFSQAMQAAAFPERKHHFWLRMKRIFSSS